MVEKSVRDNIEDITLKANITKKLATLLEDYFYGYVSKEEYNKNQALATVVVEKLDEIEDELNKLFKLTFTTND